LRERLAMSSQIFSPRTAAPGAVAAALEPHSESAGVALPPVAEKEAQRGAAIP